MYALDVIQQLKILRDYEVGYYTEVWSNFGIEVVDKPMLMSDFNL